MTEPTAESNVVEFPKKSLVKKASKYVVATGIISGCVLVALNYKAKLDNLEPLGTDEQEADRIEGN